MYHLQIGGTVTPRVSAFDVLIPDEQLDQAFSEWLPHQVYSGEVPEQGRRVSLQ